MRPVLLSALLAGILAAAAQPAAAAPRALSVRRGGPAAELQFRAARAGEALLAVRASAPGVR
jgi:hypothetical protein